jgi:hypothetical protein
VLCEWIYSNLLEYRCFSCTATLCESCVVLLVSKWEMLLPGDTDFCLTNKVDLLLVVPHLHRHSHDLLDSGKCSSCRVCGCICKGVTVSVSKLETRLHPNVHFLSTHNLEVLIVAGCSVADSPVFKYLSASVSVSQLKVFPHSGNSSWRRFCKVRSSIYASLRNPIPEDYETLYTASRVEEGLSSINVWGEGRLCTAPSSASSSLQ